MIHDENADEVRVSHAARLPYNNDELYFVKLPQWMQARETAFDAGEFAAGGFTSEIDGIVDPDGRKFAVEQTMRWRETPAAAGNSVDGGATGHRRVESNANFVRWSDGSLSLKFGNELYDVNTYSAKANQQLVLQDREGSVLRSQATPAKRMMFRPYDLKQDIHRKLAKTISARKVDSPKTMEIFSDKDPQSQIAALEKTEMEKTRARRRLESQRRNAGAGRSRRLTTADLEDDEDEEEYDDDDEEGGGGRGRDMDRYDADDDGFIVGSDEEVVDGSASDEYSDDLDSDARDKARKRKKKRTR